MRNLQEHKLTDYEELVASTEAAVDRFHALAGELRETEAALSHTVQLMGATVDFAKTRPVFDGYKAARYSKKYLAQHEAELAAYRAAKAAMNDLLGGAKLPKMDALKKERRELSEKKKALYAEYRKDQADMRQAVAVKVARAASNRRLRRDFGTICPEVQRVWGAPQQAFLRACGLQKFRSVATPELLAVLCKPRKWRKKRRYTLSYASSVSLAAFIAWIVASTIFNSFSSRALSIASMRFLHSLPLFLDG